MGLSLGALFSARIDSTTYEPVHDALPFDTRHITSRPLSQRFTPPAKSQAMTCLTHTNKGSQGEPKDVKTGIAAATCATMNESDRKHTRADKCCLYAPNPVFNDVISIRNSLPVFRARIRTPCTHFWVHASSSDISIDSSTAKTNEERSKRQLSARLLFRKFRLNFAPRNTKIAQHALMLAYTTARTRIQNPMARKPRENSGFQF